MLNRQWKLDNHNDRHAFETEGKIGFPSQLNQISIFFRMIKGCVWSILIVASISLLFHLTSKSQSIKYFFLIFCTDFIYPWLLMNQSFCIINYYQNICELILGANLIYFRVICSFKMLKRQFNMLKMNYKETVLFQVETP